MLLDFFRKKPSETSVDCFSSLNVDIHSHLVPGIDDGSDSIETSLALIEGLISLGYKKIITTPHVRPEYFPNTRETILNGFAKLKAAVKKAGLPVELACAAEYFVDYDFEKKLEKEDLLTLPGNHVLIELSTFSPPPNLHDTLFKLRLKGYHLILAHPERYQYFQEEEFQKLKDFGCLFQVNILSLGGHYGKSVKEVSMKFLKRGMVDFLGTDLHHRSHLEGLRKLAADRSFLKLFRQFNFQNASFTG